MITNIWYAQLISELFRHARIRGDVRATADSTETSELKYRIKPDKFYILSFEKGRGF